MLDCMLQSWRPGIGDPTAMGWATVLAYLAAAGAAAAVAGRLPAGLPARRTERGFWRGSAVFLAALAVNKQLDLQSALTAWGRCLARAQGWYDDRQTVQVAFILGLIAVTLLGGAVLAWRIGPTLRRTGLAALGLVLITGFVLVRAVGFHHVDALIGLRIGAARMNWILELGGIAVFGLGALVALRRPGRRPR